MLAPSLGREKLGTHAVRAQRASIRTTKVCRYLRNLTKLSREMAPNVQCSFTVSEVKACCFVLSTASFSALGDSAMASKLYVGNLPFSASEDSLHAHFATCGTVQSCKIIIDRDTGRSKGFAFVEMASSE